jgi:hypothetical protein
MTIANTTGHINNLQFAARTQQRSPVNNNALANKLDRLNEIREEQAERLREQQELAAEIQEIARTEEINLEEIAEQFDPTEPTVVDEFVGYQQGSAVDRERERDEERRRRRQKAEAIRATKGVASADEIADQIAPNFAGDVNALAEIENNYLDSLEYSDDTIDELSPDSLFANWVNDDEPANKRTTKLKPPPISETPPYFRRSAFDPTKDKNTGASANPDYWKAALASAGLNKGLYILGYLLRHGSLKEVNVVAAEILAKYQNLTITADA